MILDLVIPVGCSFHLCSSATPTLGSLWLSRCPVACNILVQPTDSIFISNVILLDSTFMSQPLCTWRIKAVHSGH